MSLITESHCCYDDFIVIWGNYDFLLLFHSFLGMKGISWESQERSQKYLIYKKIITDDNDTSLMWCKLQQQDFSQWREEGQHWGAWREDNQWVLRKPLNAAIILIPTGLWTAILCCGMERDIEKRLQKTEISSHRSLSWTIFRNRNETSKGKPLANMVWKRPTHSKILVDPTKLCCNSLWFWCIPPSCSCDILSYFVTDICVQRRTGTRKKKLVVLCFNVPDLELLFQNLTSRK